MMERALVRYGTTEIAYRLRRSGRQKTVSIAVDPEEGVLVTAPERAARDRVEAIVRAKGRWIVDRLRVASREAPRSEKSFVSGETFFYLGRQHRLRVETGDTPGVRLVRGRLLVVVKSGLDEAERAAEVRASLVRWYRDHARVRLAARVEEWAPRLRVPVPRVVVREQQRRWGSCDAAGTIRLNWRIVQAPMRLVEYVVAHELVHLRHAEHGAAFWAALGRAMPEYQQRRRELRASGAVFIW